MTQKQLASDRRIKKVTLPTLWVPDVKPVCHLSKQFHVRPYTEAEYFAESGEHYIVAEPNTPEAHIRGIAYKITSNGGNCKIYTAHQWLEDLVDGSKVSTAELIKWIFKCAQPLNDWVIWKESQSSSLSPREASSIAYAVIKLLPESQKLVELAQLQKRCGVSSWDWSQIVKSLEREFALEAEKRKSTQVQSSDSVNDITVNVDKGVSSTSGVDNKTFNTYSIECIVSNVKAILATASNSLSERQQLDQLYLDASAHQKLDRKVFYRIVATERLCVSELEREEKARLNSLLEAGNTSIDWLEVLPAPLARDMVHDAAVLDIDPVMIWQSLLATVASLMGVRINLDVESHKIPALLWTATVMETGGGKSRADDLVLGPLRDMQSKEMRRYTEAMEQYKIAHRQWERNKCVGDEPKSPALRKYLFDIATIQAVVKRCAENGQNGALWGRDELDGLFKSLGQFSKGSDEGLQILLKLWNGGQISSDRVAIADSTYAEDSALSLTGGIQPKVFRQLFSDAEDCNGLQARFLYSVPRRLRHKRVKGSCILKERLPLLYSWLNNLESTTVKLTSEADDLYSQIVDLAEDEYAKATNPAVRAWLAKWATQTMRISLILHAIECFYSQRSLCDPLQKETLLRALTISQYYRNSFEFLQEKVSVNDDISTILMQIIDRARNTAGGIKLRDTYRAMRRSIEPLAKEAGVDLSLFTEQLFVKAEAEGYGQIIRSGRTVRLVASIGERETNPDFNVDDNDNNPEANNSNSIDGQVQPLTKKTVNDEKYEKYGQGMSRAEFDRIYQEIIADDFRKMFGPSPSIEEEEEEQIE